MRAAALFACLALAARGAAVPPRPVMARSLTPAQVARVVSNAPPGAKISVPVVMPRVWGAGAVWAAGDTCIHGKDSYLCLRAHTSGKETEPPAAPSVWRLVGAQPAVTPPEGPPLWRQPLGAHDAYGKGDRVSWKGAVWVSGVDANVWEPGVYGWKEEAVVRPQDPLPERPSGQPPAWKRPADPREAYSKGDKVSHNGASWVSVTDGNMWEPGVYGWDKVK